MSLAKLLLTLFKPTLRALKILLILFLKPSQLSWL